MGALPHHVRRGRIGIVGPAGSASDEIAVRIHDFTAGVSRMVAVPADDLACADGARATTDAVAALESDDDTDVVVVVAVAAHPVAADALLKRAARSAKPVVVCLIGASPETIAAGEADGVTVLSRTKPAALAAVEAAGVDSSTLDLHALNWPLIHEVRGRHLEVLGYLMGTDADPQGYATQATKLDDAGITWASSSTNTGLLAREFVVKA